MRLYFLFCALVVSSSTHAQSAPATLKPIGKIEMVQLVATGSSTPRIRAIVDARGLGFNPDEELLKELRNHRDDAVLLAVIRSARVGGPAGNEVAPEASAKGAQVLRHLLRAAALNRNNFHARAAEPEFRAAVKADPSDPFAHLALGEILRSLQKRDAAETEFRKALELQPELADAHLKLGRILESDSKKHAKAIEEYKKAIELAPHDPLAQYVYASAQLDERDWKKAAEQRSELAKRFGVPATIPRIRVGGQVEQNKLIYKLGPQYPLSAQQAGIEGTVKLEILISRDGAVVDWEVLGGNPILLDAAVEAVKQWRYKPTLLNNEAVEIITEVDINFAMRRSQRL